MASVGHFLSQIDWRRPWLAPLLASLTPIPEAQDWRQAINAASAQKGLRNHRGLPIRFVPQGELPPGTAYETYISETGCVPTRENLHDFFNALVWLTYPRIKVRLNAMQAQEIASASNINSAKRGKVRDAATIFDENAALLMTHDAELVESLRAHDWRDLFIKRRDAFANACELRLFGHALMEKLVFPYKAITAHIWIVMVEPSFFVLDETGRRLIVDASVSDHLAPGIKTADFTPLPVLGVPGWWAGQDEAFYADVLVFRPKRRGGFAV